VLPGYVYATLVTAELGRIADLAGLLERLAPFRDEHAIGSGVAYLGPVALAVGRGAVALGRLDDGVEHLEVATTLAASAGRPGSSPKPDTTSPPPCSPAAAPATGTARAQRPWNSPVWSRRWG